jgi:hypothetical protein
LNSPAPGTGNLKKDPFVIPGGGAKTGTLTLVDLEQVPLWIRMTQMQCLLRQTEDDDDTDEVYAVVATVRPKSSNLGQSAVSASATKVYTVKRCEKPDAYPRVMFPNIPAWGPEGGAPLSIKVAEGHDNDRDAVIVVAFMERDSDGPPIPLLLELLRGKIRAELSYPVSSSVASSMRKVLDPGFAVTKGDDLISLDVLDISQDELRRAQMGEVVRLEYIAGRKTTGIGAGKTNELNSGAWIVEFQVGKEGVAIQGIELATCKDGTKWYGWSLIGVCGDRGGIADTHLHNWALLRPPQ